MPSSESSHSRNNSYDSQRHKNSISNHNNHISDSTSKSIDDAKNNNSNSNEDSNQASSGTGGGGGGGGSVRRSAASSSGRASFRTRSATPLERDVLGTPAASELQTEEFEACLLDSKEIMEIEAALRYTVGYLFGFI